MGLTFILGASGAGKTEWMYRKALQTAAEHPERTVLVIVPEQFSLQTMKDLIVRSETKSMSNIEVLSFLRLSYRVFEELGMEPGELLSDTGKSLLIKRMVSRVAKELRVFAPNLHKIGFVEEMKSLISEFYQYAVTPESLEEMKMLAEGEPVLYRKLQDVEVVYRAFSEYIDGKYLATETVSDVLAGVIGRSSVLADCDVFFDGFTGFTPSQYRLLTELFGKAKHCYMTLTAKEDGYEAAEHGLFYLTLHTKAVVSRLAERVDCPVETLTLVPEEGLWRFRESKALQTLENGLFRYPVKKTGLCGEDITLFALQNRRQEAAYIAAEIARTVRCEGLRYGQLAVVTGDVAGYGDLLLSECRKAGIPAFLDSKRKLFHNPCITLLRAVLQNALAGYSYESVFRYLKSGLTGFTPSEVAELENYCLGCGIRGERMWKQPWKYQYRTKKKTDLEALNSLRERVYADLGEISKGLNAAETAGERTELLYRFMEKLDIEEKLSAMSDRFEAEGDAVRAAEYRQVYKSIIELFDHFMELLREEKMSLREYAELMETGLRECKVGVVPPGADCVVIGDITRTRLSEIDVLFLAGVNEGVTPAPAGEGGLLSETEREFLKEKGVELTPTKKEGIYTEQFYLYAMLTKPKRRLVLTYSRLSADGKQLQPSYFLRRIGELFTDFKERETEERAYLSLLQNDGGRAYLLDGIRHFAEEGNTGDTAFFELYRQAVLTDAEMTRRLLKTAFFGNPSVGLSAEAAKRLYGAILYGSVTRLEHYASCAFAHFLQYGLSLEERAEYRVAAPELGILYHTALELFTGKVKDSGLSWHTLTKEDREEICTASVLEAAEGFENGVFSGTKRNEYLVTKARRVLLKTVEMLQEQIKGSLFEPEHCELAFTHTAKFMALHGKIDRYDLCRNEEKWYLRVIDYKSGAKKFDLTELYYGLQVQLEVYLAAALRQAKTEYGEEPLPAGMFYFHVEDPFLPREKYSETALKQAFRPEGLFNEAPSAVTALDTSLKAENGGLMPSAASALIHAETDKEGMLKAGAGHVSGEHFSRLTDFVYRKLEEEAAAILAGDTEIKPYRYKKKTPCEWCNYRSVCGFDNRMFEFGYRDLPEIAKEELWEKFGKENHGDNVHEGPEGGH